MPATWCSIGVNSVCLYRGFIIKIVFPSENRFWVLSSISHIPTKRFASVNFPNIQPGRAWKSLLIGVFVFHFTANFLVRKYEILESTQNLFPLGKTILIMKNLYRQIEFTSIAYHVAGLSYYLYGHLNHVRTS